MDKWSFGSVKRNLFNLPVLRAIWRFQNDEHSLLTSEALLAINQLQQLFVAYVRRGALT